MGQQVQDITPGDFAEECFTIQRLMGHKSFLTFQRYAHHHSESLRKGIAELDEFRQQEAEVITSLSQSGEN